MKWFVLIAISFAKILFLIRHGEKPEDSNDENLSTLGYKRADCLANSVFAGSNSLFSHPEMLIAQGDHSPRSIETLTPLSRTLDLSILTNCGRDDINCAVDLIKSKKKKVTLLAWEHQKLGDIAAAFVQNASSYPSDRFDLVWQINTETGTFSEFRQNCDLY